MSFIKPPPGFTLDDDDDAPPPPPGFSLDKETVPTPSRAGPPANAPRLPAPVNDTITTPIDGDTFRMSSDTSLRLYGVDAPELKQQGWDRQGNAVPIGQQSQSRLADLVAGKVVRPGPSVGQSYGRTVAPVMIDGGDVGQQLARTGSALAAPDFMKADPQRRFDYMQTERLARLNRLGLHGTMFQPPAEYRKAPMAAPDRETIAQFWDTPTPFAGMRPEDETAYTQLLQTAQSPDEIIAFVQSRGLNMDRDDVQRWITGRDDYRKQGRDLSAYPIYKDGPKPLTDLGDGATGAAIRGGGSGVLAGGLDEIGAAVDAIGLTPGRENIWNSDRRLADIWSNNQQQNSAILGYDESAHPYATLGGQIAGGLIVPFGSKARTVPQLARVGGMYGGAEGFLGTDGELGERAIGGAIGVPVGAALGAGLGKGLEYGVKYAPRLAERAGLRLPGRGAKGAEGVSAGEFGPVPPRTRDIIDVGEPSGADPWAQFPDAEPVNTANPGGARDRDWIDIGEVRAPPRGYTLDGPATPRSMAMDADAGPSISQLPRQRDYLFTDQPTRMDQPMTEAQRRALAENIDPRDVLPIPSNQVGDVTEAAAIEKGRFGPAKAPNERGELTQRKVRGYNGSEVPHRGPIDMVGWLRLNGGLQDQNKELSHMGLTNRARSGDFVGQEGRFGPLVNNSSGMDLDDATLRAWEAGYFPDYAERPSVSDFLDALRDTHEGRNRRFLPEDYAEIDRFHGAQQQRYDLEQQRFETGQPVYADRSVPAGDDQPFPPVQAYEEWPAGGPDFAGNINLSKLSTPQDISRALDMTNRRIGFDAATRGRISHGETERLAADLGMTPDKLLARRRGQALNTEEALAARQILAKSGNELVNAAKRIKELDVPGDDMLAEFQEKLVRHVAIQEQVSGITAEAGRALQQFRQLASSRAVRGDILSAAVQAGGGSTRLQDAAELILEAVEKGPGKFNVTVDRSIKPQFRDKLTELYINSLLTNPATHVVNMVSNTLTSLAQIPEHAVAAGIGKARQVLPGANLDRVIGSEIGQRAFGLLQGAKEGARFFWQAVKTGEPADLVSKVEGQGMKAISGVKGEIARIPTRMLTAEDEFFKGIARRMELNGLAVRQAHKEGLKGEDAKARIADLVVNPPDDMLQASMDYARYLTFQQKLGPAMSKLSGMTQDFRPLKLFLPFIRTPTNLLKFALERSPAAPLLPEWKADFKAGGARRDLAIAKAMIGTGMGMAIYEAAENGLITGSPPTDQAQARLFYADGKQPYSIRVGDQWLSYKRLDPFSTTLGIAADMALLPEGMSDRQREDMGTLLVASILGNLASKTWLSGLSGLIGAATEPDRKADDLLQRVVGGITVPAGVAQLARVMDPTARNTDSVGDAVKSRLPGLSKGLQPRIDVWGRPITSEGGIGPDLISPIYASTAREDPVNRELSKLGYAPGPVRREVGGRKLTPQEYTRYQMLSGQRSHSALQALIGGAGWKTLDVEAREDAAKDAVTKARRAVKAELFGKPVKRRGLLGSASRVPKMAVPLPPGFTEEGAAGGVNIYADLQQAIPGIRFTSGFRTPEYQADMRRRGYKPAANSSHLDGSSLDMLPPPGKSLGWLKDRVAQAQPDARLSVHDGHLHATFPGYYGAPVLEGAKRAGLKNPNAGMPPPPPGFKLD